MTDQERLEGALVFVSDLLKAQKKVTIRLTKLENELRQHLGKKKSDFDLLLDELDTINDIDLLLQRICDYYNVSVSEVVEHKRTRERVRIRAVFCKKAYKKGYALKHIGNKINRDHSTVINCLKKEWI